MLRNASDSPPTRTTVDGCGAGNECADADADNDKTVEGVSTVCMLGWWRRDGLNGKQALGLMPAKHHHLVQLAPCPSTHTTRLP